MSPRDELQRDVLDWAARCFGSAVALDRRERVLRLVEEVFELAQIEGVTPLDLARLGIHVYGRPIGDPEQEVGGINITLLAYCAATGLSSEQAEQTEWQRIRDKDPAHFAGRQNAKAAAGVARETVAAVADCQTAIEPYGLATTVTITRGDAS